MAIYITPLTLIAICAILILQISTIEAKHIKLSFQLNSTTTNCISIDGDPHLVSGNTYQLTNSSEGLERGESLEPGKSAGRIVYNKTKIALWNNSTKAIANFTTRFQFQINWTKQSTEKYTDLGGDGLAFFMAAPESDFHVVYEGDGGWLGLFNRKNNGNKDNKLVAVEFDTYRTRWDPDDSHVGIDVNNITSTKNVSLHQKLNDGKLWEAQIDYYGQENVLNVSVLCSTCNSPRGPWKLSHKINLTEYLPENVVVGFSAAAFQSSEVHRLISWNFTSVIPEPSKKNKISSKIVLIIASFGCLVTVTLVCLLIHLYARTSKHMEEVESEIDPDMEVILDHVPRKFTYAELSAGTNHFSEKEKLGQGGFGCVYKGVLGKSDETVAVKRISAGSKQGKREYLAEVTTINRLKHRNLVQLLGWCHEKGQLLLVYEYMPNGSLDNLLFGKRRGELDWSCRYKIASNIASALLYLHELWDECVVHRDVKSSNVMLDSEFNAKLGDFGLARLVKHDQWSQSSTIAGTLGYLAPECTVTGISSPESDVFSFGAVTLEIACGRHALDLGLKESNMPLVEWVWDLYGQCRLFDAVDSNLNGEFDRAEIEQLMVVGLWCSHPDPFTRPRIRQGLQLLNFEVPMPNLPHTLPRAAYSPIHGGFFSEMSDFPLGHENSQGIKVFSSSVATDIPSSSTQVSASTN